MDMRRLLAVAASAAVATSEGIGSMGAGAGRVIEVVSGRGYEEFVAEEIFAPLRMSESFFFA